MLWLDTTLLTVKRVIHHQLSFTKYKLFMFQFELNKKDLTFELKSTYKLLNKAKLFDAALFVLNLSKAANIKGVEETNCNSGFVDIYFATRNYTKTIEVAAESKDEITKVFLCNYCKYLKLRSEVTNRTTFAYQTDLYKNKATEIVAEVNTALQTHSDQHRLCALLWFLKAKTKVLLGKHCAAAKNLVRSLKWLPCNFEALQLLVTCISSPRDLEGTELAESEHWFYCFLAIELSFGRDNEEAFAYIELLEKVFPGLSYLNVLRGKIHFFKGEYTLARTFLEKVPAPEFSDLLSSNLFLLEDRRALCQLGASLMENHKFSPKTHFAVGNYFALIGNHEKAVRSFAAATQLDPLFAEAFVLQGNSLLELEREEEAVRAYKEATKVAPKDFRPVLALAQLTESKGDDTTALHFYWKVLELAPGEERVWKAVGEIMEASERLPEAEACYRKLNFAFPGNEVFVLEKLATLYAAQKKEDKEAECRVRLAKLFSFDPEELNQNEKAVANLLGLAKHYLRVGKPAEAKKQVELLKNVQGSFRNSIVELEEQIRVTNKQL